MKTGKIQGTQIRVYWPIEIENVCTVRGGCQLYHKHSTLSLAVSTFVEVPWYCCDLIVLACVRSTSSTCHAFVNLKMQISPTLIELHTTGNGTSTSRDSVL